MSRGTWDIEKKVDSLWTADGTIYRPNSDLDMSTQSTQKTILLANGSKGYFTMETKYSENMLKFSWVYLDSDFVEKLKAYVTGQEDIRITDHNSDTYIGRFVGLDVTWVSGTAEDTCYNISASFEIMNSLV